MVSKKTLAIGGSITVAVAVVIVVPSVLLTPRTAQFRAAFVEGCEEYGEASYTCEKILNTFEQAYVGKDHCGFAEENYNQLFASNPFSHQCGRTMLWSGTEDVIDRFAENSGDVILAKTLLGSVLDGLEWCGAEGSKNTFIYLCKTCDPNPVSSFWRTASAKFAEYACGYVNAILDGEITEPYYSKSHFASYEVPNLQPYKVTHLSVLLVTESGGHCDCESLGTLRQDLDYRISCSCHAATRSTVKKCMEQNTTSDDCLRNLLNSN
ncbi:ADP-ribosyl cyclase/cyclic ADP-ribose hydrolase 1-like [Notolabrus celidotus]|uniref:ADP-ribosyl cyclase/cyclic ADP-ribose hydrolase 1-like n=1 Tax=Notolabrus celidotus TaxID=1203425 RepID=UPI0014900315|nr:ADP-ribosyl cyclase/cyclic ADP-ribose hydrolase 1-like [Notolabrus celidotus]